MVSVATSKIFCIFDDYYSCLWYLRILDNIQRKNGTVTKIEHYLKNIMFIRKRFVKEENGQ